MVPEKDVVDLVLLLVLIGMDPSITEENVRSIRTAIDSLGHLVHGASQVGDDLIS